MINRLIPVVGLVLLLPACTSGQVLEEPTPTSALPTTPQHGAASPTAEAMQWASCEHPGGITVEYPAGWLVNDGDVLPECSAFDPESMEIPEASEFLDAAVLLSVEPVDFATISDPDSQSGRALARSTATVDGHDAVRVETESDGEALLDAGTRSTTWIIELDEVRTLTASTYEIATAEEYESNRAVLDQMVPRLQLPASS